VACISESNANIQISVSVAQQLTITNATGMVVQQWNATTAAPQKILLSTGTYTLKGDNEQITIVL
jgi:tRNA U34 5-carboxymethylaminomethyl modifying enzyme MnmG/GidA